MVRGAGLGFPFCVPFPLLGLVSCAEGHGLIDRLLPLPATSTQSKNSTIKLVVFRFKTGRYHVQLKGVLSSRSMFNVHPHSFISHWFRINIGVRWRCLRISHGKIT